MNHDIQFDYAEYTVITPQTGLTFGVRGMGVDEITKIKASLTTPARATQIVNEKIWDCLTSKPDFIKTYEDFLKCITLKDREALMYALYVTTFGEEQEFEPTCDKCSTPRGNIKVKLSDMFKFEIYPGSQGAKNTYNLTRDVSDQGSVDPEMEELIKQQRLAPRAGDVNPNIPPHLIGKLTGDNTEDGIPKSVPTPVVVPMGDNVDAVQEAAKSGLFLGDSMPPTAKAPGAAPIPVNSIQPSVSDVPEFQKLPEKMERAFSQQGFRPPSSTNESSESESMRTEPKNIHSILRLEIPVDVNNGKYKFIIRQPTLKDEAEVFNNVPFIKKESISRLLDSLIVKRIEILDRNGSVSATVTDREEIYMTFGKMPKKYHRDIKKAYHDNFNKYGMTLSQPWVCLNCDAENEIGVDITAQFFRMVIFDE